MLVQPDKPAVLIRKVVHGGATRFKRTSDNGHIYLLDGVGGCESDCDLSLSASGGPLNPAFFITRQGSACEGEIMHRGETCSCPASTLLHFKAREERRV